MWMTGRSYSLKSAIQATTGGSLPTDPDAPVLQSAHAILLLDGQYILQLRDNKPDIAAPGQWSLFGGIIAAGETPLKSIQREIFEELSIRPKEFQNLWFIDYIAEFEKELIRSWFFATDVKDAWTQHKLMEGQDVGIFAYERTKALKMPWVMRNTIERYQKEMILK